MGSQTPDTPAGGQPAPGSQPQTRALQGVANQVVRGLLRTPLVSHGIGSRLLTLYVVGRKSGKRYSIPVAYTLHEGTLVIGTPFAWKHNLRTGDPVDICLKGKRRSADVTVVTDEAGVVELYAVIVRDNHNFAKFNKIGLDESGEPVPADLHQAWAGGARVFRLTPR